MAQTRANATVKPAAMSAEPPDDGVPVVGNQAAYDRFLPAARELAPDQVVPFRADASLAFHNIEAGVNAVTGVRAALDARIRGIAWDEIIGYPQLALGVCFAASQVETTAPPVTGIAASLAEARRLRKVILAAADALAAAGLIPAGEVAEIHAGHGDIDAAKDCVDLVALFRKHAAPIKGNHAVKPPQLARAAEIGSWLVATLKPRRARKGAKPADLAQATDARDRLWTLLVQGHRELRRLGCFQWLEEVDAHVPTLQAHRRMRAKKTPKPVPALAASGGSK